jgi:hypothetical protein
LKITYYVLNFENHKLGMVSLDSPCGSQFDTQLNKFRSQK